jgi:DNA-binding NtrC family response regulator
MVQTSLATPAAAVVLPPLLSPLSAAMPSRFAPVPGGLGAGGRFPMLADRRPGAQERSARRASASEMVRVLVVGEEAGAVEALRAQLGAEGHDVLVASRTEGIPVMLQQAEVQCLLADARMPGARALVEQVRVQQPMVRALLFNEGVAEAETASAAGAAAAVVTAAEPAAAVESEAAPPAPRAENAVESAGPFHGMYGTAPAMEGVYRMVRRAARTDVTVLVTGESGTGKELVARALHEESRRRGKPFVALNCSALPSELVESELFGHTKGAFTGAIKDRGGLFEAAHGGTLFLDEIGDLGPLAQAKVLRALESGEVMRVGGTRSTLVDVRVVAATHRPLEQMVADGRFREDLLYRLKVITVALPPLRERREDLPLLAGHFLRHFATRYGRPTQVLAPDALAALLRHDWPGNVRELRNAIEGALVMADGTSVTVGDLPAAVRTGAVAERQVPVRHDGVADGVVDGGDVAYAAAPAAGALGDLPFVEAREQALREFDRAFLTAALERHGGNIARTARALGLHRQSLQKLLARRALRQEGRVGDAGIRDACLPL